MASKGKKILTIILALIVLIIFVLLIGAWHYGVFESVKITVEKRGPFHYVYLQKQGPFTEISDAWDEAEQIFKEQNLEKGICCGKYLDDPALADPEKLRWRVGYLLQDSVAIQEPLKYENIPEYDYVIASIKAHPMVAPFKTYPALKEWGRTSEYQFVGTAYEFYPEDGLIEVLFPVDKI